MITLLLSIKTLQEIGFFSHKHRVDAKGVISTTNLNFLVLAKKQPTALSNAEKKTKDTIAINARMFSKWNLIKKFK